MRAEVTYALARVVDALDTTPLPRYMLESDVGTDSLDEIILRRYALCISAFPGGSVEASPPGYALGLLFDVAGSVEASPPGYALGLLVDVAGSAEASPPGYALGAVGEEAETLSPSCDLGNDARVEVTMALARYDSSTGEPSTLTILSQSPPDGHGPDIVVMVYR